MPSITNESTKEEIKRRVSAFAEHDERKWGTMTAHEAVCHLADQLRVAMQAKETRYMGNFFIRTVVKKLIMLGMKAPKGKVQTVPELKQGVGGTKPTVFEKDKQALLKLIDDFYYQYSPAHKVLHPAFGPLTRDEWGKLAYTHLTHHLEQFGR